MADSSRATAAEILAANTQQKVTAVSVVEAALARAERLKHLNAFILHGSRRARWLRRARSMPGQRTGALAGLPIVVKDNINTSDLPTSGGTPALRHAPARAQCAVAAKAARRGRRRDRQGQSAPSSPSASPAPIPRRSQDRCESVRHEQDPGRLVRRDVGGDRRRASPPAASDRTPAARPACRRR